MTDGITFSHDTATRIDVFRDDEWQEFTDVGSITLRIDMEGARLMFGGSDYPLQLPWRFYVDDQLVASSDIPATLLK